MKVISAIKEIRKLRASLEDGKTVGLVPTMGYLHAGHISLVDMARRKNDIVAVSIFVNPTQFGPNEDFTRYPRDPDRDLSMLRKAKVDWVFAPSVEEMYPSGHLTFVDVREITARLEGAARPGHFAGVATVVAKLFNIMQPTHSYFGQKDAQQLVVIKKMVRDLDFSVELVVCPTVREPDGLAMSSRNVYLSAEERQAALILYRALTAAKALWDKGERRGQPMREAMNRILAAEPMAHSDYVSVADPATLREIDTSGEAKEALASVAVRFGKTRLIDNILLRET